MNLFHLNDKFDWQDRETAKGLRNLQLQNVIYTMKESSITGKKHEMGRLMMKGKIFFNTFHFNI